MQVYSCPKEVLLLSGLGVVRRVSYSWGQGQGPSWGRSPVHVGCRRTQSKPRQRGREGGREGGERRDVAWGVVDGNDVASVVKREGGDGEEKGGARRHTPLLSNERSR